jgi:hypothetical protein
LNAIPTVLDALFALLVMELIHLGSVQSASLSIRTVLNALFTAADAPNVYKALS